MSGSRSEGFGQDQAGGVNGSTRVVFFDGQRLQADDLNGAADQIRQLRWLHNRSLHAWGLALGFEAIGNTGDRQITVQPGYAVDCLGRELVLTEAITLPVPARSGNSQGGPVQFALVAAYPDESRLPEIQSRAADCGGTSGAVRLREQSLIYWRDTAILVGQEILLATASVQNCRLAQPLAVDQTRRARAIATPYVAAGQTSKGSTVWQPWLVIPAQGQSQLIGVQTLVDTSLGKFAATPVYQAQLRGDRFINTVVGDTQPPFLLDGTLIVSDAASATFTANVLLTRTESDSGGNLNPPTLFESGPSGRDALIALVNEVWSISWIGVED